MTYQITAFDESSNQKTSSQITYSIPEEFPWIFLYIGIAVVIIVIAVIMGEDLEDLQANSDLAQTLYDINFVTNWAHVLYPNGGETLSGDVEITWEDSSAFGADMLVDIYYSRDNGETWVPIVQGIPDVGSYTWNTEGVPDGTRYRIRVSVYDTLAVGEDISDTVFTINNPGNGAPDLVLISPQRGTVSGDVEITWWAADADGDPLTIDLFLVQTATGDTFYIAQGIENTGTYTFNSAVVHNADYRLYAVAYDADTFAIDSSFSTITVLNDHQVLDGLVHAQGGCNTVSINPLVYYPESLVTRTYEIRFNRIQPQPTYTYTILDSATGEVLAEGALSVDLDGHMAKDYSPIIDGIAFEFTSLINGDMFRIIDFSVVQNVSGFDGTLQMMMQDSLGTAPPDYNYRWAFRGSDYMIYWIADSATGQTTMRVVDITNGVEVPFDSTTGDNWFLGLPNSPSRYLDPSSHRGFYLSGKFFWFNRRNTMTVPPGPGEVIYIHIKKPFSEKDTIVFMAHGATTSESDIKSNLDKIAVVPNPYIVAAEWELKDPSIRFGRGAREIHFINLPPECEIRIYTLTGELVDVLHHVPGDPDYIDPGTQKWNLLTKDGHEIAYGVYIYHVEVKDGDRTIAEHIGKFGVIK